jgi:hypothetical protein
MRLAATEFLRRFFLHVLPKGFVRIRHFGFLANRWRSSRLSLCRKLLAVHIQSTTAVSATTAPQTWHCPQCGSAMMLIRKLTPIDLRFPWEFFNTS